MLKAKATADHGTEILIIGLSRTNCERLLAGKPIKPFNTKELGFACGIEILLFAGETERTMEIEFAKHFHMPE